jgi:hypothetical protein
MAWSEIMEKYFVLGKRDLGYESRHSYAKEGRMLFDVCKEFGDFSKAREYALSVMPALIGVGCANPLDLARQGVKLGENYLVAAKYDSKYHHYCYDGSRDAIVAYDAFLVPESGIDKKAQLLCESKDSSNRPSRVFCGLEVKIFEGLREQLLNRGELRLQ